MTPRKGSPAEKANPVHRSEDSTERRPERVEDEIINLDYEEGVVDRYVGDPARGKRISIGFYQRGQEAPGPAVVVDGKQINLYAGRPVTIGRNTFDQPDQSVSREHLTIELKNDGEIHLHDHSTNGTWRSSWSE